MDVPGTSTGKAPGFGDTAENDGFYLLKKDSQRRTTLAKVLQNDEAVICDVWIDKLRNEHKVQIVLTKVGDLEIFNFGQLIVISFTFQTHLELMIRALREYIIELKKDILVTALGQLKMNLDFDSTAIDHLHLALYSFQDAVISVLRKHNIKPHWMFALDNLVKSAVQAGIMVLSPELGANLAVQFDHVDDDDDDDIDDVSSSVHTPVNSTNAKGAEKVPYPIGAGAGVCVGGGASGEELNSLRAENLRLTRNLIESQRQLQSFLEKAVEEQNVNVDFIRTFLVQRPQFERHLSQGYFSERSESNRGNGANNHNEVQITVTPEGEELSEADQSPVDMELATPDSVDAAGIIFNANNNTGVVNTRRPAINGFRRSPTRNRQSYCDTSKFDGRLNDWLMRHNVDLQSRNLIQRQDFSYEDFLYELAKDDLLRIGLK